MEKNTLLLDLQDYNDLRDFKTNIENNNTIFVQDSVTSQYYCTPIIKRYISTDVSVKEIGLSNENLVKELTALQSEIGRLNSKIFELGSQKPRRSFFCKWW